MVKQKEMKPAKRRTQVKELAKGGQQMSAAELKQVKGGCTPNQSAEGPQGPTLGQASISVNTHSGKDRLDSNQVYGED